MKKIYKVEVGMNTIGQMLIVVKYVENSKIVTEIEPFSEDAMLKYKKQYEKQMAKNRMIINKTKQKTKIEKIDINTNTFTDYMFERVNFVIDAVAIGVMAYLAAKGIACAINNYKAMESPIIVDKEIEYQDSNYKFDDIDIEKHMK